MGYRIVWLLIGICIPFIVLVGQPVYADSDSQAQRLYDAERSIRLLDHGPLGSPYEAKKVIAMLNPEHRIDVVFASADVPYDGCYFGPSVAGWHRGDGGHIALAPTGRTVGVVLHEMAHYFTTGAYFGRFDIEAHGPQFAWWYVKLVWFLLGKNTAITLADAFVKYGVKGSK